MKLRMGNVFGKAHLFIKCRIMGSLDTVYMKCPFFYLFSLHRDSSSFFPSNSAEGPLMVSKGCFQPRPSEMPRSMRDSTVLNLQHATWESSVTGPSSEWNPDHQLACTNLISSCPTTLSVHWGPAAFEETWHPIPTA